MANKISVLIDVTVDKAIGSIKNFRDSIKDADGFTNKFKAGTKAAFDGVKQNAGAMSLAAGSALVAFGAKAVSAFQDTALEAGKFADAAGIAVEDASRWMEVAGDLGIESKNVETAFMRMNKSIADGKAPLAEYGVEVVRTKDGVVDANATFQNAITTIGALEDPTLRAKAAQELFGRSYGEVAELLEMNAGDLKSALEGVSSAKVIDEAELSKARDFRARLDNLKDTLEDVVLGVGEVVAGMAPFITKVAEGTSKVLGWAAAAADFVFGAKEATDAAKAFREELSTKSPLSSGELVRGLMDTSWSIEQAKSKAEMATDTFKVMFGSLASNENQTAIVRFDNFRKAFQQLAEESPDDAERALVAIGKLRTGTDETSIKFQEWAESIGITDERILELAHSIPATTEATDAQTAAMDAASRSTRGLSKDRRDDADAAARQQAATDKVEASLTAMDASLQKLKGHLSERDAWRNLEDSLASLKEKIDSGEASWADLGEATDDAISAAADYIDTAANIPTDVKTYLYQELDKGNLDYVTGVLNDLKQGVNVPLYLNTVGKFDLRGARAGGGPVGPGDWLVGEKGPELLRLGSGMNGNVVPAGQTARMLTSPAGGAGITVNVTAYGTDGGSLGRLIMSELKRYTQRGGVI